MKLHEYQAKKQLAAIGMPVLPGVVIEKPAQVQKALALLGPGPWVLKAQVHTGGRGKAGGVRIAKTPKEAAQAAEEMLGMRLVTHQTGPQGLVVAKLLLEPAVKAERELYAAVVMNRRAARPTLMVSAEGGVDIETLAATSPEKIVRADIDPLRGLDAHQARELAFAVGLTGDLLSPAVKLFSGLSRAFLKMDANLVEINPLAVVKGVVPADPTAKRRGGGKTFSALNSYGSVVVRKDADGAAEGLLLMDAKVTIDDNAFFRQTELFKEKDESDLSPAETRAGKAGISYVRLDGNIGCLVNGAGLAMATMDLIKLHGGEPANFLDVGGGANVEQVTEAFKILLSDKNVRAVFVNIFGGIMKCDVIAEGILQAVRALGVSRPLVVRLEGNRVEEGRKILGESGLDIVSATDLTDGAKKAVELAARA